MRSADLSTCKDADGVRRVLALLTGRYDEAIASPEAVQTDRSRLMRGLALAAKGRSDEARSALSAVQQGEFAEQARLAEVLLNLKMPPEVFTRTMYRPPQEAPEQVGLTTYKYYLNNGSSEEVLGRLETALGTEAAGSQLLWSTVLWRLATEGASEDAKRLSVDLEKRGIQGSDVHAAMARSRRNAHDCRGALPLYRQALEEDPGIAVAKEMLECEKTAGTDEELAAFNPLRPPGEREDPSFDRWMFAASIVGGVLAVCGWMMGLAVATWLYVQHRKRRVARALAASEPTT